MPNTNTPLLTSPALPRVTLGWPWQADEDGGHYTLRAGRHDGGHLVVADVEAANHRDDVNREGWAVRIGGSRSGWREDLDEAIQFAEELTLARLRRQVEELEERTDRYRALYEQLSTGQRS